MKIEIQPDGTTKEIYDSPAEYRTRGYELYRTRGRRQIVYEGWMAGELVRILR